MASRELPRLYVWKNGKPTKQVDYESECLLDELVWCERNLLAWRKFTRDWLLKASASERIQFFSEKRQRILVALGWA